ncbi:hypothetical protein ACX5I6_10665 [Arthrobacter sp. MMS24-T111]
MHVATIAVVDDVPPLALLWPLLLAGGVYWLLSRVIRGARDGSPRASRHAFLVGLIGWLASSLVPAANAGIIPLPHSATIPAAILPALAWPVLGCLAAHVLGQLSYPRPQSTPDAPGASRRRIRDIVPRRLGWTVAAIFAGAAAHIAWMSALPGFPSRAYESRPDGHGGFTTFGGEGRIPGQELAPYLGGALIVLAAGTLFVLALAARRPPLAGLAPKEDDLLRTIAGNRLLRTVATVASGLGAIAGNHAARPDPATGLGSWTNPAGALNLVVLAVMLFWRPPALQGQRPPLKAAQVNARPETMLAVSVGPAMGLAAFVPVPVAIFVPWAVTGHAAPVAAVSAAAILAVVSLGDLVMHRNYGSAGLPRHWPRQPVHPALMVALVAAAAVMAVVVACVAGRQAELAVRQTWEVTVWTGAGTALLAAVPLVLARRRRSVAAEVPGLDAALRAITVHRVARTLTAFFAAQAGLLLMSAGPNLGPQAASAQGPWDAVWQGASGLGALLTAAAVVIAVAPVSALARGPEASLSLGPPSRLGA